MFGILVLILIGIVFSILFLTKNRIRERFIIGLIRISKKVDLLRKRSTFAELEKEESFYDWTGYDKSEMRERYGVFEFKDEYSRVFENYYGVQLIVWYGDINKSQTRGFQLSGIQKEILCYSYIRNAWQLAAYIHEELPINIKGKKGLVKTDAPIQRELAKAFLQNVSNLPLDIKDFVISKLG